MKIILIGASGTVGKQVLKMLEEETTHEVIRVGKTKGDFQVDIANPESIAELYKKLGSFDAVVNASGDVAFAPFRSLTKDHWNLSLQSKLLGQINLVQQALPYINENGTFTLISGILGDEQIAAGTVAATVNKALEGFVKSVACELPKNLRINLVSPTVLQESLKTYGDFFPGFKPAEGFSVAQAYKKSILGVESGKIIQVY